MFKRKLLALDHPTADKVNVHDETDFRSTILWLEDQKIRHYRVEDRSGLRNLDSPSWNDAYKKFLSDAACPIKSNNRFEELEWLLTFAVRLEYADNIEKYKRQTSESLVMEASVPKVVSANSLDKLDFQSPEFSKGVDALANILHISPHPDHLITLSAVSSLIQTRLSTEALENPSSKIVKGTPFPFQEIDVGVDMGDYVLNQAVKIMRLLNIHQLRDLQTKINECIVAVQTVTANPKTDTKLGQVGR